MSANRDTDNDYKEKINDDFFEDVDPRNLEEKTMTLMREQMRKDLKKD